MLKKLLKYDLKWILKVEYIWSVITIIFAILTRLTSLLNESVITSIIKSVLTSITITGMLNVLFNGIIRTWIRVRNNLYKDEAYLTHTLPVESKTILSSKVLSGIITMLFGILIIIILSKIIQKEKQRGKIHGRKTLNKWWWNTKSFQK